MFLFHFNLLKNLLCVKILVFYYIFFLIQLKCMYSVIFYISHVKRKPAFCISENKGTDQLPTADQHLCFHYTDSTIPLLPKSKIASL